MDTKRLVVLNWPKWLENLPIPLPPQKNMNMTSQEEDLTISKEDNLTGQGTYRKTTLQEVSHTGRQPQKETTLQENILTGRQPPLEYGLEKRK